MKTLLLIAALSIGLAGCATSNGTAPAPSSSTGILSPFVDAGVISAATRDQARVVQTRATEICGYVPTIGTLLAVLSGSVGATVGAVANGLCNAITTTPLADGGTRNAYYKGVKLRGTLKGGKL